jgi:hypothetical protein
MRRTLRRDRAGGAHAQHMPSHGGLLAESVHQHRLGSAAKASKGVGRRYARNGLSEYAYLQLGQDKGGRSSTRCWRKAPGLSGFARAADGADEARRLEGCGRAQSAKPHSFPALPISPERGAARSGNPMRPKQTSPDAESRDGGYRRKGAYWRKLSTAAGGICRGQI